jgi:16S rRNA (guanine966-N2)-methyltransferase
LLQGGALVKISSGWSKGLKILTPPGLETRPTRERIRQSAINMLAPWIIEAKVLDLFAGSGAVGIELASRGAAGVVFSEVSRSALDCLRKNAQEASDRAAKQGVILNPWSVEATDAHVLIKNCSPSSFDLIWADPPYELVERFVRDAGSYLASALCPGGVFALESRADAGEWLPDWGETVSLELKKQRAYGTTLISVWQKN